MTDATEQESTEADGPEAGQDGADDEKNGTGAA